MCCKVIEKSSFVLGNKEKQQQQTHTPGSTQHNVGTYVQRGEEQETLKIIYIKNLHEITQQKYNNHHKEQEITSVYYFIHKNQKATWIFLSVSDSWHCFCHPGAGLICITSVPFLSTSLQNCAATVRKIKTEIEQKCHNFLKASSGYWQS